MHIRKNRGAFTLIELLVVIAIIAILSVIIIIVISPAELLRQSRDASRLSDLVVTTKSTLIYNRDVPNLMGLPSTAYISVPDPSATSTAGDQCQGLGLPALPSGWTYHCASPSTYRQVNGTGWMPPNFTLISSGAPVGSLPVDPVNQTSSNLYYTYATDGNLFEITAIMESQKYKGQYAINFLVPNYPEVLAQGTNFALSPLWNPSGLVGYWNLSEGGGSSTIDGTGNGAMGAWQGDPCSNGTYYAGGKIGPIAGCFTRAGNQDFVSLGNPFQLRLSGSLSAFAWVERNATQNYEAIVANLSSSTSQNFGPFALRAMPTGAPICSLNDGTQNVSGTANSFNTTGVWYNVGCVVSSTVAYVYLNGVLQASGTVNGGGMSYANGFPWMIGAIGSSTFAPNNEWGGYINDVRIYNRALSPAEVQALYNAEK